MSKRFSGARLPDAGSARNEAVPVRWQPREPPLIVVDGSFVLDRWRLADGPRGPHGRLRSRCLRSV